MSAPADLSLRGLVRISLAIHNLNKSAEQSLGLSLVQYHVLTALLELPGCTPLELANASGVHPSTLTQTLKILDRKDLIFVDKHPKDSRKKILVATRKGRDQHAAFVAGIDDVLKSLNSSHRHSMESMGLLRSGNA